jgi:hypothetical protein
MKLNPIIAKNVQYHNDGTARDTYISQNCGGFYMVKSLTPSGVFHKKAKYSYG